MATQGKIVLINGTSSAGKSTFAKALQKRIGEPFCYYASDQLADAGFRSESEFAEAPSERDRFFDGFHRSTAAFAGAGNNLIVEHIVEERRWADDLKALLAPFDVFWVGLHASLEELDRRERERGDRPVGEARFHLKTHQYCHYDIEIDPTRLSDESVEQVIGAWHRRFADPR